MTCCNLNLKKVFLGGIAAGVWINLIEWTAHWKILGERYMNLTKMGFYVSEPRFPFMPVNIAMSFGVGLLLACLYAACRDNLKPGACAAIKVGLAVGLIAAIPGNVAVVAWSAIGKFVPFVTCLATLSECVIGTLIAGALYKSKSESAS